MASRLQEFVLQPKCYPSLGIHDKICPSQPQVRLGPGIPPHQVCLERQAVLLLGEARPPLPGLSLARWELGAPLLTVEPYVAL